MDIDIEGRGRKDYIIYPYMNKFYNIIDRIIHIEQ